MRQSGSKIAPQPYTTFNIYPEKEDKLEEGLDKIWKNVSGWVSSHATSNRQYHEFIRRVNAAGSGLADLSDQEIRDLLRQLRQEVRREGLKDELVARSFAMVREAARRTIGMIHYDVQLFGGLVLLQGKIAEMETGEGKTLVATLPACTMAMTGVPVHVITVNDYLTQRDADWMRPVYEFFGLTVGTVLQDMTHEEKQAAYNCDITYCTNKTVTFDYLRDRILLGSKPGVIRMQLERLRGGDNSRFSKLLLRGLFYAIVDEADSVLVDEARTPLIISGAEKSKEEELVFSQLLALASELVRPQDFLLNKKERFIDLTEAGKRRIGQLAEAADVAWIGRQRREELAKQALTALYLFERDKDYLIKDGKVQIIDEFTGRLMEDRSWERGLHQFIELKEECEMTGLRETLARIGYQRFFRRYQRLAGMTGTAREVAGELRSVYGLQVVAIPTNKPLQRIYLPDQIFTDADDKWTEIVAVVKKLSEQGRPVLVGTRSVAASEHLSRLFEEAGLEHEVLNARQDQKEAEIIKRAGERGRITIATNMAGRGTDIVLGPGVSELGGLHVIATERHEAGRIDRQLFGRCSRQGDPGSCEAILSLEDELVQTQCESSVFLYRNLLRQRKRVPNWLGVRLVNGAQKKAEKLHARMRQDLLKMDQQLGTALAFAGRKE